MAQPIESGKKTPPMPDDASVGSGTANNRRGLAIALAILVAVLALATVGYQMLAGTAGDARGSAQSGESTQEPAADALMLASFDAMVQDADGARVALTGIADGRPLVINFWATWCPYCLQEFDDYQDIYHEYSSKVDFAFVDATDGQRETLEGARGWVAQSGYDFPVYYDVDLEAVNAFGVRSFPTTVVVSADGEILTISAGMIDPSRMRAALDSIS